MSWFSKKKKEGEGEHEDLGPMEQNMVPVYIPMSKLLRSVVYDAGFPNPEDVIDSLGLQRVSNEVAEMEQTASDDRLDAIDALSPLLAATSALLARATVAYSTSALGDITEEQQDLLSDQFQRVAMGASVASLSSLVDLGLVTVNGEALGITRPPQNLPEQFFGGWDE